NMGADSGTGVAFTRNPATGEAALYGEYLVNAQGEDVVAGVRTPQPIASLAQDMPDVHERFLETCERLENQYHERQAIAFTIERVILFILQTRNGKRTAQAAVQIVVDMAVADIIDTKTARFRVDPDQLSQLLHSRIDHSSKRNIFT